MFSTTFDLDFSAITGNKQLPAKYYSSNQQKSNAGAYASSATTASDSLKVATVFGSNMVLQRDRPVPIWGKAQAISANDQKVKRVNL